jgi:hypothetical protein
MATRLKGAARDCCLAGRMILTGALVAWAAAAPLVWILRDGLGPDAVDSDGVRAAFKLLVGWGVPALALAVPLAVLSVAEHRLTRGMPEE